jgi:hypothetical protein
MKAVSSRAKLVAQGGLRGAAASRFAYCMFNSSSRLSHGVRSLPLIARSGRRLVSVFRERVNRCEPRAHDEWEEWRNEHELITHLERQ